MYLLPIHFINLLYSLRMPFCAVCTLEHVQLWSLLSDLGCPIWPCEEGQLEHVHILPTRTMIDHLLAEQMWFVGGLNQAESWQPAEKTHSQEMCWVVSALPAFFCKRCLSGVSPTRSKNTAENTQHVEWMQKQHYSCIARKVFWLGTLTRIHYSKEEMYMLVNYLAWLELAWANSLYLNTQWGVSRNSEKCGMNVN